MMMEKATKISQSTRVQAQAKMVYALVERPLSFDQWVKKAKLHPSTLRRHIPILLASHIIRTLKKGEKSIGRQTFALGVYTDLEANIKEALDEFHKNRVMELNWEDLENHPKVHRILTDEERNFALCLASSMEPPIKMTDGETKYHPRIAVT